MKKIILVQADNIGDLIVTQPLGALLKRAFPLCQVIVAGRPYIEDIVAVSPQFDGFMSIERLLSQSNSDADAIVFVSKQPTVAEWAARVNIPLRIASRGHRTTSRFCTQTPRFNSRYTRRHQALSFLQLLAGFALPTEYSLPEILPLMGFRWATPPSLPSLDAERFNLIIHPGTNGHTREWPMGHFVELIQRLPATRFKIFITGSQAEADKYQAIVEVQGNNIVNLMGQLSLQQLVYFIASADGMVANSTGPMHLGAAAGIHTLGLFPPRLGATPSRWAPLGPKAQFLVHDRTIPLCLGCSKLPLGCACMQKITVKSVADTILAWIAA
jgi:heptosyltransferase-3